MGSSYAACSTLRDMMLELVRMAAPSCTVLALEVLTGPFRPRNWRIGKLDVLVEDYPAARDKADELQALRRWICVPDGHRLDGQVYGREQRGRVGVGWDGKLMPALRSQRGRSAAVRVSLTLSIVAAGLLSTKAADAGCSCVCVNGQKQPLCASSYDQPVVCLSSPCPIVPRPLPPPISRLSPPIGTSSCRLAQVDTSRGYAWRRICR